MRITISIGKYATIPYIVPGLDAPVYCVEELCYLLGENAVLIDQSIMTRSLAQWVESECELPELADQMYAIIQRQGSLSTFVCLIMEYTGLQDTYYIDTVRKVLKKGAGLSAIERHKSQIDYMVSKKKYLSAIRAYHSLIEKWNYVSENKTLILPGINVLSAIYHNLGVAYVGLMLYDRAAGAFKKAYSLDGDREHYLAYIAAKRMGLNDSEYIDFAAGLTDGYEDTLRLEKTIESIKAEWESRAETHQLKLRKQMRDTDEAYKYYSENDRILKGLKDSYRENVSL
jgi:tetratricopeptide (TPR) repeat protein